MLSKSKGRRKRGRPRMRWLDSVEKDLKNLGMVNLKRVAFDTNEWKQDETYIGL